MPNKLRLNIDLAKVQGAQWFKSPKTGEMCLVIVPSKSRAKYYPTKQEGKADSLYASLEVVPLKNPPLDREDTHFVVEPTTRDERESENPPRLPILGNAREFAPRSETAHPGVSTRPQAASPAASGPMSRPLDEDMDDEIPF